MVKTADCSLLGKSLVELHRKEHSAFLCRLNDDGSAHTLMEILVDPAVSRTKFEAEISQYKELEADYLERGWWMLKAEFPEVFVVFAASQLRPAAVVFGAILDFTNYDLWPPSVRLVDPFSRKPYKLAELPSRLLQRVPANTQPELAAQGLIMWTPQPLMQGYDTPDDIPFLCLPGVREYHQHPAHSGDSWLLHRGRGEGTLYFILSQLYKYGVQPLRGYQIGLAITGLAATEEPPE